MGLTSINFFVCVAISFCFIPHAVFAEKGDYRGCFADDENMRDLPYKVNSPSASLSADQCIEACAKDYYTVAGLHAGKFCFCGSNFGRYGISNCTIRCEGNSTQFCGGTNANSIYETGFMVPGPPQNITLTDAKENSLVVRWVPPQAKNGIILQYKVFIDLVHTYLDGSSTQPPHLQWMFSNTTYEAELSGLAAGSEYNVTVLASSTAGDGKPLTVVFWTEIGEPERPQMADVIDKEVDKMTIRLPEVHPTMGPISAYQVVVYEESASFPWDPNRLTDYKQAKENKLPFYIAAELLPQQAKSNFVVGDGGEYGGYYNSPLDEDKPHTVIIGVVSRLNGISKAAYSPPSKYLAKFDVAEVEKTNNDHDPLPATQRPAEDHELRGERPEMLPEIVYEDSALVTALGIAIGIGSALLVASIVVYFMLRRHYERREQPDHQELTLQSPSPVVSENGIVSSILVADDEGAGDLDFLYDSIKDKFWQIPRPYLEVMDEVLGEGRYGTVHKGLASRRNHQTPIAVQIVQAHLSENERVRRSFLNDLDAVVRLGTHTNVIALIGGCEDNSLYFVCVEWYPGTLKEFLLDSRTVDHYPVFAERQNRTSTLKELQLLELALGVARGMAHLAQNKVIHRRLTSRGVIVVDDAIAKVTDFGLMQTEQSPNFDLTRWLSMENLKNRVFTTKSDVWSFGVVIWEMVTLGGTPYATVKTKDLPGRILRGSRLHQPKNVGDDLYQMMLQCWQVDMDERPSFQELASILGNMVTEGTDIEQIHLDLYPGFQYEKYEKELEVVNP